MYLEKNICTIKEEFDLSKLGESPKHAKWRVVSMPGGRVQKIYDSHLFHGLIPETISQRSYQLFGKMITFTCEIGTELSVSPSGAGKAEYNM